ncbi:MAG: sugar phosphate isomerase/epimerase [Deltaproteobacteria bacterium]|nr:sugar phosphate isomerase/epimerase [Deltaproteobacteria bacterium]
MKIVLSSGTLYNYPLIKVSKIAKEVGYDGLEVVIGQEFHDSDGVELLQQVVEVIPVYSLHAPFYPIDGWGYPIKSLLRTVVLAHLFSIPLVNFHPPSWAYLEFSFKRWLYKIKDFQKEVGKGNVMISIENMPYITKHRIRFNPHILKSPEDMIDFINKRNLYLTFDCTHMGTAHTNFIEDFFKFYHTNRIRNIHFSDYGYGREHLFPGRGVLPLTRFLNHLKHTSYNFTLTLELVPSELPKEEPLIKQTLMDILRYLRKETVYFEEKSIRRGFISNQ